MARTPKIKVIICCLLWFIILISGLEIVDGYSETYTRTLQARYRGYMDEAFTLCKLQTGDRIEASFTISNLGPYTATVPNDPNLIISRDAYYKFNISFAFEEERGTTPRSILNFPDTKGDSFSYTASKSGMYWIHYWYSGGVYVDAKDPEFTINYDIIKAQTPAPITPTPTVQSTASPTTQPTTASQIQSETYPQVYIFSFVVAILLAIGALIVVLFGRRRKAKLHSQSL
ncbi:MAG: hypothetical protein NWE92_12425 [Candidatus Bathyarchaeota archaeon]|nr:hypothetical protein [Candidatus Bathyarchaeota archaeon]